MEASTIPCSRCSRPLPATALNTDAMTSCPFCASSLRAIAFPALLKPAEAGSAGELILIEGEASCFYHSEKKAVITCAHCGRFLCSLCDVELGGEHLCPPCIESGKKKGKLKNLENHRVRYDDVALAVAILPMLFCYVVPITAPIALYVAIRHWKSPGSIIPRTRVRFVLAILFAVIEIVGSIMAITWLVTQGFR